VKPLRIKLIFIGITKPFPYYKRIIDTHITELYKAFWVKLWGKPSFLFQFSDYCTHTNPCLFPPETFGSTDDALK
jgi:hypothetical protein